MDEIEVKLSSLLADEASYRLLLLMLQKTARRINFDQGADILSPLRKDKSNQYEKLKALDFRFNGLCELISNCVIADNLMGSVDFY